MSFGVDAEIVPAYTYTASASVVAHVGATIVLVDSQKDNVEMDYDKLADALSRNAPKSLSLWILLVSALMWIRFVR